MKGRQSEKNDKNFTALQCGTNSVNFPYFWAVLPEPEMTSLLRKGDSSSIRNSTLRHPPNNLRSSGARTSNEKIFSEDGTRGCVEDKNPYEVSQEEFYYPARGAAPTQSMMMPPPTLSFGAAGQQDRFFVSSWTFLEVRFDSLPLNNALQFSKKHVQ